MLIEGVVLNEIEHVKLQWFEIEDIMRMGGAEVDLLIPIVYVIFHKETHGRDEIDAGKLISKMIHKF